MLDRIETCIGCWEIGPFGCFGVGRRGGIYRMRDMLCLMLEGWVFFFSWEDY